MTHKRIRMLRSARLNEGKVGAPGDVHRVPVSIAHTAVAYGNAEFADEDSDERGHTEHGEIETRDPRITSRDPRRAPPGAPGSSK